MTACTNSLNHVVDGQAQSMPLIVPFLHRLTHGFDQRRHQASLGNVRIKVDVICLTESMTQWNRFQVFAAIIPVTELPRIAWRSVSNHFEYIAASMDDGLGREVLYVVSCRHIHHMGRTNATASCWSIAPFRPQNRGSRLTIIRNTPYSPNIPGNR